MLREKERQNNFNILRHLSFSISDSQKMELEKKTFRSKQSEPQRTKDLTDPQCQTEASVSIYKVKRKAEENAKGQWFLKLFANCILNYIFI